MYNDRLKWASFPRGYKTGMGNFVLPGLWLCSLTRWFILIHFSMFSDFAIIFSWADITLKFSYCFCPRGQVTRNHGPSLPDLIVMRQSECLYSLLCLCQLPSWDFFAPFFFHHHSYVSTCIWYQPEWADGTKGSRCALCSWELCSSAFMFICSSGFLLVWFLGLPGA